MNHRPTRRTILCSAGAAALCAGCGDDGGGSSASPTPGQDLVSTDDVPVGGGTILTDRKIVVTQPRQGEFKAFSAVCTHRGCTVSEVADGTIDCPCHGSRFRVADGSVERGPAAKPLPPRRITVEGRAIRLA